jgi:hypothetical protein
MRSAAAERVALAAVGGFVVISASYDTGRLFVLQGAEYIGLMVKFAVPAISTYGAINKAPDVTLGLYQQRLRLNALLTRAIYFQRSFRFHSHIEPKSRI